MLRKSICILVTLSLILSMICVSAAPSSIEADDSRLTVLKSLEIVKDYEDESKLSETMSKSTFINFLLNMMYGGRFGGDFDEEALNMAADLKIIDSAPAVSKGDTLKGTEAVKMAMCLLGYRDICMKTGGFPLGYLNKASQTGVTKGIEMKDELTNADAYKLLYNTMNAGIVDIEAISVHSDEYMQYYSEYENVTILDIYRDIHRVEGVVTANCTSDIYGQGCAAKDSIEINEKQYADPSGLLYDSLGYRVSAYVRENAKGGYDVICAEPDDKNNTFEFKGEDVKDVEIVSGYIRSIEYYPNKDADRTRKTTIKSTVSLIYNGVADSDYTPADFKKSNGNVLLIDNDGDGVIDVIRLDVYETMIVSSISASEKTVNGEYTYTGAYDKLETEKYNGSGDKVRFFLDGEAAAFEDIKPGDVLSVFESRGAGNKSIEVYISKNRAIADITKYSIADKELMASDIIYEISDTYFTANQNNEAFAQTVAAGRTAELYLDMRGRIVGIRYVTSDGLTYGYLKKAPKRIGGIQSEFALNIFDENGTWQTLYLAEKVSVSDKGMLTAENAHNDADDFEGKIIGYELDKDGKVDRIELPVPYVDGLDEERLSMTEEITGRKYRYNNTSFDSYHYMTGSTRVFIIPSQEPDNEALYDIGNNYSFESDKEVAYQGYGCDEFGFLDVVLIKTTTSKNVGKTIYLVRDISKTIDSEGNVVSQVKIASSTYLGLSISVEDETLLSGISQGDLVKFHVNAKGYIDNIESVYSISSKNTVLDTPSDLNTSTTVKGKLSKADFTNERILLDSSRRVALKVANTVPVLFYEADKQNLRVGTVNDLVKDDYIIADISKSKVMGLYVMRYFE